MIFKKKNIKTVFFIFFVLISNISFSQIYNTEIEAKIDVETNNEFIKITASALNKTEISQSIRYVLSVIKNNPGDDKSNISKNDQSGRKVLAPSEKANLSATTINANQQDRIILLLLIYNLNDEIIGKDRIVFNDNATNSEIKEKSEIAENMEKQTAISADVMQSNDDGLTLKGIVIENTKTKPGRDFYALFFSDYLNRNIKGDKIVNINEELALGRNTKIEVKIENDVIFEFFLRPQNDFLKSMSNYAMLRVINYFENQKRSLESGTVNRY